MTGSDWLIDNGHWNTAAVICLARTGVGKDRFIGIERSGLGSDGMGWDRIGAALIGLVYSLALIGAAYMGKEVTRREWIGLLYRSGYDRIGNDRSTVARQCADLSGAQWT